MRKNSEIVDSRKSKVESRKSGESRSEYHKNWAKNKEQISIRIDPDLKNDIDKHVYDRNEKLSTFVVRAIKEQIRRDNYTKALNIDALLSD